MKAPDDGLANSSGPTDSYLVAMLGAAGVGKCALLSQFRTSECINAYETGRGEIGLVFLKEKVSVCLLAKVHQRQTFVRR